MQQHLPLAVLKLFNYIESITHTIELQQHLPLAVLKLKEGSPAICSAAKLQQHLPLAVLKPSKNGSFQIVQEFATSPVATALTACGIETL